MGLTAIKNKIKWVLKRHPLLYYTRFALIAKNHKAPISTLPIFSDWNKKEDVHPLFYEVNSKINLDPNADELDKALAIATYLRLNIKGGRGLGLSSNKTLELMLAGKGGVCSDFSQIFNLFCLINDIKGREWGSVEKFYNPEHGHTFNEIYSTNLGKYILIDVKKSIRFEDEQQNPLGAVELFMHLKNGGQIKHIHFSPYICNKIGNVRYIYSKGTIAFVISNYDNKVYDEYLNKYQDQFPSFLINAMLIILRKNYNLLFVLDDYRSKLFPTKKKTA